MREIINCHICSPKECIGVGEKKRFYLCNIDDFVDIPRNIVDCPILRRSWILMKEEDVPPRFYPYEV